MIGCVSVAACSGGGATWPAQVTLPAPEGLVGWVARSGLPDCGDRLADYLKINGELRRRNGARLTELAPEVIGEDAAP